MLAEIYMLRLGSGCAGGQASGDKFVSVRACLVAGCEGVVTSHPHPSAAIPPLPASPTPSRRPSSAKTAL